MATFYAQYPASSGVTTGPVTVQGEGTAGTPTGGVLTVQGDPAGTPIPITGSISATNPSVSTTGTAVPADATYVGMSVSGNLTGMVGTANGLKVDGSAVTQPISAASLPLPTGAATAAKQPALGTAGSASTDVLTVQGISSMTPLLVTPSGTGSTQPTNVTQFGGTNVSTGTGTGGAGIPRVTVSNDSNVLATQSGTWNITNVSGTVSLPTGASTSALQTTGNTSLASIDTKTPALGQTTMAGSTPVAIASNQSAIPVTVSSSAGRSSVLVYNKKNGSANITTSAYTQITASTSGQINRLYIADTSGQGFFIATGAAASEVNVLVVPPGGNDSPYELQVAASTRLSVKALTANMTAGYLYIVGLS